MPDKNKSLAQAWENMDKDRRVRVDVKREASGKAGEIRFKDGDKFVGVVEKGTGYVVTRYVSNPASHWNSESDGEHYQAMQRAMNKAAAAKLQILLSTRAKIER